MNDIQKEIQRLKYKTLYLWVVIICLLINTIFFNFGIKKNYSVIRDYYYDSLDLDRELNQKLQEQNQALKEILSNAKSY